MLRFKRNKKIANATECLYNDIRFKSKLEMYCYKELERSGLDFSYEYTTFTLIEKFRPIIPIYEFDKKKDSIQSNSSTVRASTNTPDFIVMASKDGVSHTFILECKGMATDSWIIKWKLLRSKLHKESSDVKALFIAKNQIQIKQCIDIIKQLIKQL